MVTRHYTDCGGGLCTTVGGMCDACADEQDEVEAHRQAVEDAYDNYLSERYGDG